MVARMNLNSVQSLRMSIANLLIFSYNMSILILTTSPDATTCDCRPPFTSSQLHPCMTPHDWLLWRISGPVARRIHMEVVGQSILTIPQITSPLCILYFLQNSTQCQHTRTNGELMLLQRTNLPNMQKPKESIWYYGSEYFTVVK